MVVYSMGIKMKGMRRVFLKQEPQDRMRMVIADIGALSANVIKIRVICCIAVRPRVKTQIVGKTQQL